MSQGREPVVVKRGPGRPPRHTYVAFAFKTGDLVLVKWNDGMVYFAKIKRIDHKRQKCVVVFDDKSQDEAHFSQIHSVDETTTDIICIKCKKDDSDKPNEIVLCDTCGIGFHQKCHIPNIPASALELDTPWNCSYCQKGVKCPYLTESLDVLQNLLSDDEEENSVADEVENTAVLDSDLDAIHEMQQVSPRKKRGRKPAATGLSSEVTATRKSEKRKVQASLLPHPQSSGIVPLGTSSSRVSSEAKAYAHDESDSDAVYLSSGRSTPEPPSHPGTKRKKHHNSSPHNQIKKHKRSSVESRTVSVTRVSMPICENGSAKEMDTSRDSSVSDTPQVANHDLSNIEEESGPDTKRPRTLRVSLSIPDDVEPGTPFDKVVKAHQKIRSPPLHIETKELPSWENFANSNVLNALTPKERPCTLLSEKENDILDPKSKSVSMSESSSVKEAGFSQAASSSQSPSAFLASPLPISSSPKLHSPVKLSVSATNVKTTVNSPSPVVGTTTISSPEAAVGYSTLSLHGQSLASEVAVPSSPVVKSSQSEMIKCRPLNQPPLRNPQLHHQPQASVPSQASDSQQTICPGATPGITQASTSSPLSVPTKPTTLPTGAPVVSPIGNQPVAHNQKQKQHTPVKVSQVQQPVQMTQSPAAPPVKVSQVQQPVQMTQSPAAPPVNVSQVQHPVQMTQSRAAPPVKVSQVQQPVQMTQSPAAPPVNVSQVQQPVQMTQSPAAPPVKVSQVQQPVQMTQSPAAPPVVTAPSKQTAVPKYLLTSNISAQQVLASPATQVRSTAAVRTQAVPQPPTQKVLIAPSRPSSVPTQQQVIMAPPSRPSSVPTQHRLLVTQSQAHQSTAPAQRVLVANSQPSPNAVVQQVVVAQQPHCVAKGVVHNTSVTLPSSISAPSGVPLSQYMTQEHQLQQNIMVSPKTVIPVQSGGDADVIITGVEPNRVAHGPMASAVYQKERVTVTTAAAVSQQPPPGERIVFMGSPPTAPGPGLAYHQPSATAGKKVTVDLQQMVAPVSAGSLVTPIGSHSPVSVVPVVLTPTNDLPSTQVLYQVPRHPHAQPPSQGAQPTHIIREASLPTPPLRSVASTRPTSQVPTSVIVACSPTAASNVAHSSTSSVPGAVVYSAIGPNVAAFSSVNTTKPYAIVNAMPGTQIVYTASQGVQPSQVRGAVAAPAGSLPQPPKTYSHVSEKHNVGGKMHHSDVVQTISKKIGDAFDSGNEQLLVAAFEDAWKRFQANGKQYEPGSAKSMSGREGLPPNAEVFSVPGTGSRVNLVRQTSNGSNRVLASKMTLPHSTVIAPPPLSSQPQTNYVHTAANTAQTPVYLQPVTVGSAAPAGQQHQLLNTKLQSTGLFYPPSSASSITATQKKATAGTSNQRVIVSQSAPVVRHSVNSGGSERTQESSRKPRSSSSKAKPRFCSRCGKSATYLCSGCHAEWYCGRECQLKAWDTHADTCKA